jgi:hypothetical protein
VTKKTRNSPRRRARNPVGNCDIPPALPKEELYKLTFKQLESEVEEIRNYVEWQGRGKEKVLHAEKITSEMVMGREYQVWDVHTDGERWWVITNPTNLYSQRLMPSMDYTLSFHIGLMLRLAADREPKGTEAEQELLLMTNRKLVQAGVALDEAKEAEDFQTVGMHCRECLLAMIRELTEEGDFGEASELLKKADFKAWAEVIANAVAAGSSAKEVRSYLKKIADETWQLTNWLTHAGNGRRPAAVLALAATGNVVASFAPLVLQTRSQAPERCGRCGSYQIEVNWHPEIGDTGAYVPRCRSCGAEAYPTLHAEPKI